MSCHELTFVAVMSWREMAMAIVGTAGPKLGTENSELASSENRHGADDHSALADGLLSGDDDLKRSSSEVDDPMAATDGIADAAYAVEVGGHLRLVVGMLVHMTGAAVGVTATARNRGFALFHLATPNADLRRRTGMTRPAWEGHCLPERFGVGGCFRWRGQGHRGTITNEVRTSSPPMDTHDLAGFSQL